MLTIGESKLNDIKATCITCQFFAHDRLYKKDLVSFETVDICRRYPKHVGIADSQSHWCGEYIQDMNLTKLEIGKRIKRAQEQSKREVRL